MQDAIDAVAAIRPPDSGGQDTDALNGADATLENAIEIARVIQKAVEPLGMHAALGGGCLHKTGPRKDVDVILYEAKPTEVKWGQLLEDRRRMIIEHIAGALAKHWGEFGVFGNPKLKNKYLPKPAYGRVWILPGNSAHPRVDVFFTRY